MYSIANKPRYLLSIRCRSCCEILEIKDDGNDEQLNLVSNGILDLKWMQSGCA